VFTLFSGVNYIEFSELSTSVKAEMCPGVINKIA
jgi:hypothetical protein